MGQIPFLSPRNDFPLSYSTFMVYLHDFKAIPCDFDAILRTKPVPTYPARVFRCAIWEAFAVTRLHMRFFMRFRRDFAYNLHHPTLHGFLVA